MCETPPMHDIWFVARNQEHTIRCWREVVKPPNAGAVSNQFVFATQHSKVHTN